MFANYTATVQEVLEVGTVAIAVPPDVFAARLEEVIQERIELVAQITNTSLDRLSGVVSIDAAQASATALPSLEVRDVHGMIDVYTSYSEIARIRRKLQAAQALDTSACDATSTRVQIEILMESATHEERARFMDIFNNADLGNITNITGTGVDASVCAPAAVTAVSREVVDAPPPPPAQGLTVPPSDPLPRTVFIIAAVVVALVATLGGAIAWYSFGAGKGKGADSEKQRLAPAETSAFLSRGAQRGKGPASSSYFVLDPETLQ